MSIRAAAERQDAVRAHRRVIRRVMRYNLLRLFVQHVYAQGLRADPVKSKVIGLSRGGLVEIVRVRKRPSLMELMTDECPTCQGCGRVEKGA